MNKRAGNSCWITPIGKILKNIGGNTLTLTEIMLQSANLSVRTNPSKPPLRNTTAFAFCGRNPGRRSALLSYLRTTISPGLKALSFGFAKVWASPSGMVILPFQPLKRFLTAVLKAWCLPVPVSGQNIFLMPLKRSRAEKWCSKTLAICLWKTHAQS